MKQKQLVNQNPTLPLEQPVVGAGDFWEGDWERIGDDLDAHQEKIRLASELLPAWFTSRMMDDVWSFGLMLATGVTIGISRIDGVSQDAEGTIWIDCRMLAADPGQASIAVQTAPCPERTRVSIAARHVVAAFELAST